MRALVAMLMLMILPALMILCCSRKVEASRVSARERIRPRGVGAGEISADQVGENAASRPSPP